MALLPGRRRKAPPRIPRRRNRPNRPSRKSPHSTPRRRPHQRKAENAFLEKLAFVTDAATDGKQVRGLLLAGGFGSGKSHLLDYLRHLALDRNFVCSRIVISKETPLFDPAKIYQAAVDAATVPALSGEAIRELALRLEPGSRPHADFVAWANSAASGLSDLLKATLLLHERLNNDPELVDDITNFWAGEAIPISRVRQGLKQIGCAGLFSLKTVKAKELALRRFRFTSRLILAAGCAGWLLLIDEVELIGRYSALQRGRSYAELARWMGRLDADLCPGLLAVAAITDDFGLAVLQEKSDKELLAPKFRAKATPEYIALAARADTGMRLIEREALTLAPPSVAALDETYRRLKAIHATAYTWDPPELPAATLSMTRRMRSYVRRWVNVWDLNRLYPGQEIDLDTEQDLRPAYQEDAALDASSE